MKYYYILIFLIILIELHSAFKFLDRYGNKYLNTKLNNRITDAVSSIGKILINYEPKARVINKN